MCILDLYNCTGTAQVCKNQFSQCKYDLEVSEGKNIWKIDIEIDLDPKIL